MPIIVKASFPKKNKDALFWGGEEVACTIKITNSTADASKNSQEKRLKNIVVPPTNDVFVKSKSVIRRRKSIDSIKHKKSIVDMKKKKTVNNHTNLNISSKPNPIITNSKALQNFNNLNKSNNNSNSSINSANNINSNNNNDNNNSNDGVFSFKRLFRRSMSYIISEGSLKQEYDKMKMSKASSIGNDNKGKQEINESSSIDDTSNTLIQKNSITSNNNSNSNISQTSLAQSNFTSDVSSPNTIVSNFDYDDGNLTSAGPLSAEPLSAGPLSADASSDNYSNIYEIKDLSGKGTQINIRTKPSSNNIQNSSSNDPVEVNRIELNTKTSRHNRKNSDESSIDSHFTGSSNASSVKKINNMSNNSLYGLEKKYGDRAPFLMSTTSLNSDFEIKSYYNSSTSNLLENSINNSLNSNNIASLSTKSLPTKSSSKETLSIGYIQVMGKCTLDGNHINLNLFESVKSKIRYGSKIGGGGSIGYDMNKANDPKYNRIDIPIYSTAPGILFCNLTLEPGETKIFDYSIVLPTSLPPTYYGRSLKINYSIHIGIQKTPLNTTPYSITLPFKVFSYAEDDGSKPSYDIMNPVIINKDLSTIRQRNTESLDLIHSPLPYTPIENNFSVKIDDGYSFRNVCNLCQQATKVSYEICKDNENVAQLLFTRSVYRLGESIIGIIKFKTNALRCYQVTTYLETNEQIEYPYALRSKGKGGRVTKKVIAQQQDFCLNNSKIFVELPIPLYATPEFNINAVNLNWFLRFEFITSSNEKIMNVDSMNNNFIHTTGISNSNVETFDCKIPIKVYGSKYGIQSSKTNDFVSIYIY